MRSSRVMTGLVAVLLMATTACTNSTAAPKPSSPDPVPIVEGISVPAAQVSPTTVTASDDLRAPVKTYLGAMHTAAADGDGAADLPTRMNAAAVISAFDADGNVVGRAVTVKLDGFTPADVVVDYRSTAFTRLLTTPQFVTDNPLAVMLIRGAAERSPNLDRLAEAIAANAATNPNFETEPTSAETEALAALAEDTRATLARVAAQMPDAPAGGANRAAPAWAMPTTAAKLDECLDRIDSSGNYAAHGNDDPFCVKAKKDHDGGFDLTVENDAAVWGLVFAAEKATGEPRIAGVVNPYVFVLPSIDDIISALLYSTTKVLVSAGVSLVCEGASWLGVECPEEWVEEFDPSKFFETLVKELNPVKDGEANLWLSDKEATLNLAVYTPGTASGPVGHYPGIFTGIGSDARRNALLIMSLYSSVVEPMVGLMLGDSVADLGDNRRADGPADIAECDLGGKHKGTPCSPEASVMAALLLALEKSENLTKAANAAMSGFASGDINEALPALADVTLKLFTNVDVLTAIFQSIGEDVVADALQSVLLKFGVSAVPGPGWLVAAKEATDATVATINGVIGGWNLLQGLSKTPTVVFTEEIDPQTEEALASTDWASAEVEYEAWLNTHGFFEFRLQANGSTTPVLPDMASSELLGVAHGTWKNQPVTLVAVQSTLDPNVPYDSVAATLGNAVHLNLFGMTAGMEPKRLAAYTDYPGNLFYGSVTYAFEGDRIVSYNSYLIGSSGAAQDMDVYTYTVSPSPASPTGSTLLRRENGQVPPGTEIPEGVTYGFKDTP